MSMPRAIGIIDLISRHHAVSAILLGFPLAQGWLRNRAMSASVPF